jgi:hypothetical protein
MKALDEPPSVTKPSSTSQASCAPASFAACLARTCASRLSDLMSRRCQRRSGTVTTAIPVCAAGALAIALAWVNIATVGLASSGKKKSRSATPRVTWK